LSSNLVEPKQLRRIRTQLGYTQVGLAKAAGVSQSIIAKIESGKADPTFSTLSAISRALSSGRATGGKKAADVMSSPVIGVQASATLKECVDIMKKNAISQMPVFSGDKMIGTITESHVMAISSEATDPRKVLNERVSDHALPVFAVVARDTPVEALFSLFRYLPAVIVASEEKVEGIITKIDLLAAGM
jgi:predicted transcriptional regulator